MKHQNRNGANAPMFKFAGLNARLNGANVVRVEYKRGDVLYKGVLDVANGPLFTQAVARGITADNLTAVRRIA